MRITGRTFSILLVFFIQTAYIYYYFQRDGFVGIGGWMGYPLLLPIGYWTGYQFDKAKFLSEKDWLTGLYNRHFIESKMNKFVHKAKRNDEKLFIILLDCDKFKEINDGYGHRTGDLVLKEIALKLKQYDRKVFASARWGGDEFLIVGSCSSNKDANDFVEDLQQELVALTVPNLNKPLSVSIGLAIEHSPESSMSVQFLIQQADQHMYKRKKEKHELIYT
ncbi:GGDEF domain-containing protein [Salipaludibacillus daqingensis]|uniref:GGDEF domain-containing protein n=1 Tax=Salipaludibacillus daqingensis TaxID=3041001 RepID=UPI00247398A1|nr:GGDEF domain-containing protein [Salipaludibacillus daqingensis]